MPTTTPATPPDVQAELATCESLADRLKAAFYYAWTTPLFGRAPAEDEGQGQENMGCMLIAHLSHSSPGLPLIVTVKGQVRDTGPPP